jgi:hypothetical protein
MIALPDKKGYFEFTTEAGGNVAKGSRSKGGVKSIIVHFYAADGTTEMNPAPTDVTMNVGAGADSPMVTLSPQPSGGFASAPGQYPSGFRGRLKAKIGGEAVETPFMIR